jgi:hypothetical protein
MFISTTSKMAQDWTGILPEGYVLTPHLPIIASGTGRIEDALSKTKTRARAPTETPAPVYIVSSFVHNARIVEVPSDTPGSPLTHFWDIAIAHRTTIECVTTNANTAVQEMRRVINDCTASSSVTVHFQYLPNEVRMYSGPAFGVEEYLGKVYLEGPFQLK